MHKKFWMLASLMLVLSLVLTACPSGGQAPAKEAAPAEQAAPAEEVAPTEAPAPTATPVPTEEPAPTEEAAPAEEAGPSLVIWADNTRAPALEAVASDFEAQYGVKVEIVEIGFGDIRDQFKVAAPAGEGPDIIIGAHDWLGELVVNGLLAEIDLGEKADQFLDAAVNAFMYDGKLYGMPYATENVAFVYNPEIVTEVPTTWSEVEQLAAQLEADGVVKQGYVLQEGDPYHFFPIQTAFGGYVFGLTDQGYDPTDVGIDSPGSLAAAEWLDKMVKEGHLQGGIDWETMHAMFESGDAAMFITGPWSLSRIRESGIPYAITTLPGETQDSQPFLGVQGFMVSAFSEDPLLAQLFLTDFVATEQTMRAIFEADPRPSAFLPVRESIDDPDIAGFAEAGANGLPMPAIPEMSAVWSAWGDAVTLIFNQSEDPDTAFKTAAEQIRAAISGE
jgi:maltose/maltodextrin transport system substrate-binding protein/arabinogalactan oligomer/maltooligosaccharide transport system substrate-binding protein